MHRDPVFTLIVTVFLVLVFFTLVCALADWETNRQEKRERR